MPRPQQQQPSPDSCVRSLAQLFRSLLFVLALSLSLSLGIAGKKRRERGRKRNSFLPADSLLSLSTLSLPVYSFSLYCCLLSLHHSSSISLWRTCHVLTSSLVAALFLLRCCLLSHPRDGPIFSSYSSYREQSLTSASNASCRRTSSTDSVLALRVHARACISLLGDICSQLFHNEVARIRTPRDFTKHFRSHRCYRRMRIVFSCLSFTLSFRI